MSEIPQELIVERRRKVLPLLGPRGSRSDWESPLDGEAVHLVSAKLASFPLHREDYITPCNRTPLDGYWNEP